MQARKKIRQSISGLPRSHLSPALEASRRVSLGFSSLGAFGMRIKNSSVRKAREKVARSTAITRSMPEKANSAEASTGCRIVLREPERDRRPLVRW